MSGYFFLVLLRTGLLGKWLRIGSDELECFRRWLLCGFECEVVWKGSID